MQMPQIFKQTIDEIIAEDRATAPVFEKFGIDPSREGSVTFSDACSEKGICPLTLHREIVAVKQTGT